MFECLRKLIAYFEMTELKQKQVEEKDKKEEESNSQ